MNRSKLFSISGCLLILGAFGLWACAGIEREMVGGEVRAAMRSTGKPPRFWTLQWNDWVQGPGGLTAGRLVPKRFEAATITAHRVGRAQVSFLNSINLYEAKYAFTDGRSEVWAAHGPNPPVEISAQLYGLVGLLGFLGTGCIFLARRSKPLAQAAADGLGPTDNISDR